MQIHILASWLMLNPNWITAFLFYFIYLSSSHNFWEFSDSVKIKRRSQSAFQYHKNSFGFLYRICHWSTRKDGYLCTLLSYLLFFLFDFFFFVDVNLLWFCFKQLSIELNGSAYEFHIFLCAANRRYNLPLEFITYCFQ